MIQANQWYNIAVSNLTPSSTNVKLTIGIRQVNFNVSVDWGNILLTITQSVIVDIKISLRVRNLGEYFYIDVRSDTTSEDIISASLYDNNYWNIVSPAPAGSGETICIINDISEYNPETGGGSSSGDLILIQKELIVIGERINNIEDWFTLRTLTDGRKVLYTKYNLATAGDMSLGGISEESDVPTGTATTLGGLLNVDSTADDIYSIDKILVKKANETHYSVMDLSEVVGLDEDALSKYLTTNSYATHSWVEQQGYLTEHQDISGLLSKTEATNTYATQAALGTLQTAHDTLRNEFNALEALLSDDTAGVIDTWNDVKAFLDGYSESEDLATILSKMNAQIDLKANQSDVNTILDWFTLRTLTDGRKVLYTKYNIAAAGDISAGGISEESDVPTGTATTLGGLLNVDSTADDIYSIDKILVKKANETHYSVMDLSEVVGLDEDALSKYLTTNSYATHSWVEQQGYLKEHQDISGLLSKDEASNIYATQAALGTLQTAHNALRNEFNDLEALLSDDTAGVIDTWNDVKAFLDGYSESEDLATILSKMNAQIDLKANQSDVNTILDWFALRTLSNGKKVLYTKYGIAMDGEISVGGISDDMGGDSGDSYSRLDSWDNYNPANGDVLSAVLGYGLKTDIQSLQEQINNMGGGGLSSVTVKIGNTAYDSVDGVVSLPSYPVVPTLLSEFTNDSGYITESVLNGKDFATQSWVKQQAYINSIGTQEIYDALGYLPFPQEDFTPENIKAVLGISDWALAVSKPSYAWSEITGKPSFATVATSGKYSDLSGLPTIPTYNFTGVSFTSGNSGQGNHNCNNITSNGHWYYGQNGPAASLGATSTDGALYTQAYSDIWVAQIAQDYRNGNLFTRGRNNGSWSAWKAVSYNGHTHTKSQITDFPSSLPASDVYSWAKASTKPSYNFSEINNKPTTLAGYGITDALSTSGGTITNPLTIQTGNDTKLIFNNTDGEKYTICSFRENGTQYAALLVNSGGFFYNNQRIIHSGNIGEQSVASATKLQTARTIWGQSFDGTGNVGGIPLFNAYAEGGYISTAALMINKSGSLFGIGTASNRLNNISFGLVSGLGVWESELMTITNSGNVLIGTTTDDGYKLNVNGDVKSEGFVSTSIDIEKNSQTGEINRATGKLYLQFSNSNHLILCMGGGNVGIGTTVPAYKLDVSGTGRFTDTLTIGGATLTWDETNNCLRVNTNFAADGELTAGGASGDDSTDTGVSYNRLDSWDAYNAGAGDVLSATLGYGLKMNIEAIDDRISNLQSQIDALGSGSGGSVSGDYLPLTGGTLTGSITVKGANTGYMWARESDGVALGRLETDGVNLRFRDYNQLTSGGYHTIITHQNIGDYAISNTGGEIYGDLYTYANITSEAAIVADFISGNSGGEFYGDVYIAANLFVDGEFNYSDMRYKDVLENIYIPNDVIADAPIFRYRWADKFDNKLHIGTSAQYWEEYDNTLVSTDPRSGKLGLNYISLAVAMGQSNANEIRELKKEIVKLKERLAAYEQ